MAFSLLNLVPEILKALIESGYTKPTPIQETAIPKILEGCDLLASAQTGSGKTAAFILPALNRLTVPSKAQVNGPRVLILVPTRELAMQVATQAVKYSKHMSRVRTVCLYGGAPYPVQNRQLSRPYEILVATPGRLIDHLERGRIDFSNVEMFVLDEADRMLDMGFIDPVEHIASQLPKKVQTVLFSATLEGDILRLSKNLLKNPVEINLASSVKRHENIEQMLYYADNLPHKLRILNHLLENDSVQQTIIFTSTKAFANELTSILKETGQSVGVLHGDLDQRRRTSTTRQFREGKITILVATDVAARGIDIQGISHVINFDLPPNVEDYVHRIGRTGRADAKGVAFSLALPRDKRLVERIEKLTDKGITTLTIPGLEPSFKEPRNNKFGKPRSRSGERPRRPRFGSSGQESNSKPRHTESSSPSGESRDKPKRSGFSFSRGESRDKPKHSRFSFSDGKSSEKPRRPRSDSSFKQESGSRSGSGRKRPNRDS